MKLFNIIFVLFFLCTASAQPLKTGFVDIIISDGGLPLGGYKILIDEKSYTTDEVGVISLELGEGNHKLAELNPEIKPVPFKIVEGERTQLLINIIDKALAVNAIEPQEKANATKETFTDFGEAEILVKSVDGKPVVDARLFAKGVEESGGTDRSGAIVVKLPVGKPIVSISHPKFSTQVVRDIVVKKGERVTRTVELTPSGLVLEDFVVLAPNLKGSIQALIEVRRKATDVADVMSAEQMAKTGDGDAAGSLRRVTGLTLKDGKYVYVRGLGERYSSTLLNGVSLPSPDPSRRVVPLDLFPVQFLDNMVIQKSYSPNQPGEFGGGVVMLQTKSMPEKFYVKAVVQQSQNSNDGNMQTYQGGGQDWLGVDDGGRKLPHGAVENPNTLLKHNHHALEQQKNESMPDFFLSVGDRFNLKPLKIGYTASGLYRDDINYVVEQRGRYRQQDGQLVLEDNYSREKTQKERTLGGIFGMQFELFKDHKLSGNLINLRNSTDYVAVLQGDNAEGNNIRETGLEWAARSLNTILVQGESQVAVANDLKLKYHFATSKARRDEPNRITSRYSPDTNGVYKFNPQDNTAYERRFYDLQEKADDMGAQMDIPFPWYTKQDGLLGVGLGKTIKDRQSSMRRFAFNPTGQACNADLSDNLDVIFDQCQSSFNLVDVTRPTDNYIASQELQSYFVKSQFPILESLELNTGMRFERSIQNVNTVSPFEKTGISSQLTTRDWLPASSLTWKFAKKMQTRLAYSETISRPDLRELSDTLWQDFETGYDVSGNPNLKAAVIRSYDARWEWYFSHRENLSLGVFFKDFTNPIEQVFTAGSDPRISFFNVNGATVYGAEIEFAKDLGFMTRALRHFTFAGNYAHIISDVSLGNIQNSESKETNRPLQGQSNYTANFLLDYALERFKLNASLAYNVYGKRIAYTAPEGLPNIWELPVHQLDFVMVKSLASNLKLRARVGNILNSETRLVQEDRVWQSWRVGQTYTLGIQMEI